ncbi:MAG: hypothetical protein ACRD4Y_04275, partial [Candidatus Acidiferrales bacterium]
MSRGLTCKAMVLIAIVSLLVSPVFVQAQQASAQDVRGAAASPGQSQAETMPSRPVPVHEVKLGLDYSAARPWFPNPIKPYTPSSIAPL